MILIKRGLVFA